MWWAVAGAAEIAGGFTGNLRSQRDLQVSPLAYGGGGGGLWLDVEERAGRWRVSQDLALDAAGWRPSGGRRTFTLSGTDPIDGSDDAFSFRESITTLAGTAGLEVRRTLGEVALGGRLQAEALDARGIVLSQWAWTSLELGPSARWTRALSPKVRASASGSLPLLAVVTRYPDTLNPLLPDTSQVGGFFATGTRMATVVGHQRVALGADVELAGWGRWWWCLGLRGDWLHDASPDPLYRLGGAVLLGGRLASRRTP